MNSFKDDDKEWKSSDHISLRSIETERVDKKLEANIKQPTKVGKETFSALPNWVKAVHRCRLKN